MNMNLTEAMKARHSVRQYKSTPIGSRNAFGSPDGDESLQSGKWAAYSACDQ